MHVTPDKARHIYVVLPTRGAPQASISFLPFAGMSATPAKPSLLPQHSEDLSDSFGQKSLARQPTVGGHLLNAKDEFASSVESLREPLLARFPDWRPIAEDKVEFKFLNHEFYLPRAASFITYDPKRWLKTLSGLPLTRFAVTPTVILTLAALLLQPCRAALKANVPLAPMAIVGGAVAFLMVFRMNNAYIHCANGRAHWGQVITLCDSAGVQATALISTDARGEALKKQFLTELLAFPVALKNLLRGVPTRRNELTMAEESDAGLMTEEQLQLLNESTSPPLAVVEALAHTMRAAFEFDGQLPPYQGSSYVYMLNLLQGLVAAITACELCQAKIPHGYIAAMRTFLASWLCTLPFALVGEVGLLAIPLTGLVSLLYLSLEEVAMQVETPFGMHRNDLCLEGYCMEIERVLLEIMHRHCGRKNRTASGAPRRFGGGGKHDDGIGRSPKAASSPLSFAPPQ